MNITNELLDELRDIQLIDNNVEDAERAWKQIEETVVRFSTRQEAATEALATAGDKLDNAAEALDDWIRDNKPQPWREVTANYRAAVREWRSALTQWQEATNG